MSPAGAKQALLDHFLVGKLTADVADLNRIILKKDSTITRLKQSVYTLTLNKLPEQKARSQIEPVLIRESPKKLAVNWPKVENWGWRGLFVYLGVQAIRSMIN